MKNKLLRVLNVEDQERDVAILHRHLSRAGYEIFSERVETSEAMHAALETQEWDVILCDYSMPQFNAPSALALLKETGLDIPFIIISGTIGEEVAVQAMLYGANDYLIKDNLVRLVPAIERELEEARNRSARGLAEKAVQESEDRYRDLVENSFDLICTHDLEGRVLSVNRMAAKILGYPKDSLLGRNIREILLSEYRHEFDHYIAQIQEKGIFQGVMKVRTSSGEKRIWEYTNTLRIEGVDVPIVRGVAHDITEQKHAESALRESEERYRHLFESNPFPMWVYDLETLRFLAVNEAAVDNYGYSTEEFLSMTITDIHPPEDIPAVKEKVHDVNRGINKAGVRKHLKKDGTVLDVEITSHQITFGGKKAELVLPNDITERRKAEEALRTSEEQLQQSQKLESIGQLAGGIAHDFNNLLTAIIGFSELSLRQLQAEDPLQLNIKEIKKAGERAADLTRQLLAFSRKQVLQPKVLNVNSIVSDFEKMLQRLIGEDVRLWTGLEPELGSVKADPGQIEQVILNLIINARDAMPKGGKLTIETKNVYLDDNYAVRHIDVVPGHYVMLAVTDNGTGMNEQTKKNIFDPFFTTKELGKGTGLGLSTVYGIVKQSGGNIWVYSELGHGTTFKVYLPRVDEVVEDYKLSDKIEENIQGTETILLAEDEDILRRLVCEVLQSCGYQVLTSSNGGSALLMCERHQEAIHLLITDVIMPEMSGRELAERLSGLRPEMKVLYMSGYTDHAIVQHGVLNEGINFIQKPFTPDSLQHKIREILDEQ